MTGCLSNAPVVAVSNCRLDQLPPGWRVRYTPGPASGVPAINLSPQLCRPPRPHSGPMQPNLLVLHIRLFRNYCDICPAGEHGGGLREG